LILRTNPKAKNFSRILTWSCGALQSEIAESARFQRKEKPQRKIFTLERSWLLFCHQLFLQGQR